MRNELIALVYLETTTTVYPWTIHVLQKTNDPDADWYHTPGSLTKEQALYWLAQRLRYSTRPDTTLAQNVTNNYFKYNHHLTSVI